MSAYITKTILKRWGYQCYLSPERALTNPPDYRYTLYCENVMNNEWCIWISHPHGNGESITLSPEIKRQVGIFQFLAEQQKKLESGIEDCEPIEFPDNLFATILEQSHQQHWQCVTLEDNNQITNYNASDFEHCHYCVHVDSIPGSVLGIDNGYVIQQPIIANDGGVYEFSSFEETYKKRYKQGLYSKKPMETDQYERLFALYSENSIWRVFIAHQKGLYEDRALPPELLREPEIADFLTSQHQTLLASVSGPSGDGVEGEPIELIAFPDSLIQYLFLHSTNPADKGLLTTENSRISDEEFSPANYRRMQFACRDTFPSKLNPNTWFDPDRSLVGVFHPENCEDDTILTIEKTELHGNTFCGRIDIYQFRPGNAQTGEIDRLRHRSFCGLDYAFLTQEKLLGIYHLSASDCCGRIHATTPEKLATLERDMRDKQEKVKSQLIRYAYRSGKLGFNLLAWLLRVEYHNAATLFIHALMQTGIFTHGHLDPHFRIVTQPTWRMRLLGATPDRLLPQSNGDEPSSLISGHLTRSPS